MPYLVGGWPAPLKNMVVSWDHYSQYMESYKIHVQNHQPGYTAWYVHTIWHWHLSITAGGPLASGRYRFWQKWPDNAMSVCTPHWSVAPSTFETQLDTASGTLPNEFRSTIFGPWSPGLRPSTFSKADAAAAHVEEAHQGVPLLVDADAVFILSYSATFWNLASPQNAWGGVMVVNFQCLLWSKEV